MEVTTQIPKTDKLPHGQERGGKQRPKTTLQVGNAEKEELGKNQKNRRKSRRRTRLRYHPEAQKEMPEKGGQKKKPRRNKVGKDAMGERTLP